MRAFPSDRIGGEFRPRRRRQKRKPRSVFQHPIRRLVVVLASVFVLSLLLILPFRWINPPTTAFMLQDQSGRVPVQYRWVAWDEIGVALPLAVVAAEDQKFASHFGFDIESIRTSVEKYSDGAPLRGASTVTQQVAKNLYLWPGKSLLRKGIEAYFTVLIELTWSKKRILEMYLNIVELGPGVYGVGAASEIYFGQAPYALRDSDAALLAAVLPNPKQLRASDPSPYVRQRQHWILGQMQRLRRDQWLKSLD